MKTSVVATVAAVLLAGCGSISSAAPIAVNPSATDEIANLSKTGPHAKSVVIVMMENRDYNLIIGSSQAPYINGTLVPEAALMTNSHAIGHPSQPNYLAFFSGSTQGITDDSCPHTFSADNVGEELIAAGKTFDGYSESMPHDGYTGCSTSLYARKHNPWVNFTNVPSSSNLVYNGFVEPPPTLSIIVPNLCNDMHDCNTKDRRCLAKEQPAGDTPIQSNARRAVNSHLGRSRSRYERDESDCDAADRSDGQAGQEQPARRPLLGASHHRNDRPNSVYGQRLPGRRTKENVALARSALLPAVKRCTHPPT